MGSSKQRDLHYPIPVRVWWGEEPLGSLRTVCWESSAWVSHLGYAGRKCEHLSTHCRLKVLNNLDNMHIIDDGQDPDDYFSQLDTLDWALTNMGEESTPVRITNSLSEAGIVCWCLA